MTWAFVGLGLWILAVGVVLSFCAAAGRADATADETLEPLPEPVRIGAPFAPAVEARCLARSVEALAGLIEARHVTVARRSGEVLVQTGDAVHDPEAPSLVAPLFCDGQRVGTVTARRSSDSIPFSPRQFETFYAVAVVLGASIEDMPGQESAPVRRIAGQRRLQTS